MLSERLAWRRLAHLETLVITKTVAGFEGPCVQALTKLILDARSGRLGPLKFLVMDFAHPGSADAAGAEGFSTLVSNAADLILQAPIVSIAYARAHMTGADLEFALGCSMLIGERGAKYSFAADPLSALGIYGFLAQKIGFVRAERLMEGGEILDADGMRDLLILKDVIEAGEGSDGLERFLRTHARRHNSCYGIYRAQRIASPSIYKNLRTVHEVSQATHS